MAFGLPAFFGSKAPSRVPVGVDVTSITDISGSMGAYADFITSPLLYESLETALRAEGIGTAAGQTNRYSFCTGGTGYFDVNDPIPLNLIERDIELLNTPEPTRWAPGADVLAQAVDYPTYITTGADTENIATATNAVSNDMPSTASNPREYIFDNERIIIAGSDAQAGQGSTKFDRTPEYPSRYVGLHEVNLSITENSTLPPKPAGRLVGFVYTTASQGVAIYIASPLNKPATIKYRTGMPTNVFNADAINGTKQSCINQCKTTNGAVYYIRDFTQSREFALLGESLGTVLGKYLYSVS